jgi:3-deoxy-D-manno-octulosonate 8-phosphate phosphatase (KDO 8-P phosphatase)
VSPDARARRIRLLLFDVDGVMTNGKILLHPDGTESKQFDIKDGSALVLAQKAGLRTGLLSARQSTATAVRAAQLQIRIVHQNVGDKLVTYGEILRHERLDDADVAYMGDDVVDLPVLARVGLAAAPADAALEVRQSAHWISQARGGDGAVRELIEFVLKAQDRWRDVVGRFVPGTAQP